MENRFTNILEGFFLVFFRFINVLFLFVILNAKLSNTQSPFLQVLGLFRFYRRARSRKISLNAHYLLDKLTQLHFLFIHRVFSTYFLNLLFSFFFCNFKGYWKAFFKKLSHKNAVNSRKEELMLLKLVLRSFYFFIHCSYVAQLFCKLVEPFNCQKLVFYFLYFQSRLNNVWNSCLVI